MYVHCPTICAFPIHIFSRVPSTLNKAPCCDQPSPQLSPFPTLKMNHVGDCRALQNVATIEISPDGRLYAADSGTAGIFSTPIRKCKAKLVIFDLTREGKVTLVHEFSSDLVGIKWNSVLMHMAVDYHRVTADSGPMVYLSDINSGQLVILDVGKNLSWKVTSPQMSPVNTMLNVEGEAIVMRFGITGIALRSGEVHNLTKRTIPTVIIHKSSCPSSIRSLFSSSVP